MPRKGPTMCRVNHRISERRRRRGIVQRGDALVQGARWARPLGQCCGAPEPQGVRAQPGAWSLPADAGAVSEVVHGDRCRRHAQTAVTTEAADCRKSILWKDSMVQQGGRQDGQNLASDVGPAPRCSAFGGLTLSGPDTPCVESGGSDKVFFLITHSFIKLWM